MAEPICRICWRKDFKTWGDIATHILTIHKENKKDKKVMSARKWAANFKYKNVLYGKKEQTRVALTEEQKESKEDTKRIISGETKFVPVKCPRCKIGSRQFLEAEHVDCPEALKIENCFVKLCEGCR
jgi:hypothetical protein